MGLKKYLALATEPGIVKRGLKYSVIVGSVLVLINHGDALFAGTLTRTQIFKILLTYTVPYVVSSLSSIQALLAREG